MNIENDKIRIGILGDELTGKTNILNIFNNQNFNEKEISTNGCIKTIKKINIYKEFELIITDISGEERYRNILIKKLKNSLGLILVYSINNKKSFENCEKWLNEINRNNIKNIPIILIGNKCDLEEEREVNKEEGLNYANKNGFKFFECSAKKKININESIYSLIYSILGLTKEDYFSIPLNNINNPILISIIGDKNVGKSYIINNTKNSIVTIINDIEFSIKIKLLEYNILEYNEEINKNSGIILIFNINDKDSFEKIKKWIYNNKKIKYIFFPLILIGYNKDNNKREISLKNIEDYINKYFIDYYEISNIEDFKILFQLFIKNIILYNNNKIIKTNDIQLKRNFGTIITNLPKEISIIKNDYECFGKCIYENGKYEGYFKNNKRNKKGIMIYNNGDIYEGYWLNDKKNGKGIINYHNNEIYEGDFVDDKKEGNGAMNFKNDNLYKGEFKNNEINGYGEMLYLNNKINGKNCKIYKGEWKNNKYNGKGKLYFENNEIYELNFKNGKMESNGKIKYNNGDEYEGFINNLNKNGYGIMKYKNGDIYIGNWLNDKKEGRGMFENNNGNIFEGYFKNDKRENGIFYSNKEDYELIKIDNNLKEHFKNNRLKGIIYKCNYYINNKLNGKGLYINPNEYLYEGNFKNDKREGEGIIIYKNGDIYNGKFKNDKREGEGIIKYYNNNRYNGNWKNDKIEGKGIYQFNNGILIKGNKLFSNEDWEHEIKLVINKLNKNTNKCDIIKDDDVRKNKIFIIIGCQKKFPINKSKIR